jgi:hypothetical protein
MMGKSIGLKEIFCKIVKCRTGTSPTNELACPDQYVGLIGNLPNPKCSFIRTMVRERPANTRCLILILESPHKNEYINPCNPIPANGQTGENIRKFLKSIEALNASTHSEYGLILMNAIEYQCSLGLDTSIHRSKIFRKTWRSGGRDNFLCRLKKTYKNDDIILNCCTGGKNSGSLQSLVQNAVKGVRLTPASIPMYRGHHPSFWKNAPILNKVTI